MRIEHWSNAVEQGRHAMRTLLGDAAPYAPTPSFWSDQFGARLRFVGSSAPHTFVESVDDESLVLLFGSEGYCVARCA